MFRKILVPTDGSALSEKAAKAAIQFAAATEAAIVTVAVAHQIPALSVPDNPGGVTIEDYEDAQDEISRKHVNKIKAMAEKEGVQCDVLITRAENAYEEILLSAKRKRCDLIWMASRARNGLQKFLLGSETQRVLSHTAIPVLVWKKESWDKV